MKTNPFAVVALATIIVLSSSCKKDKDGDPVEAINAGLQLPAGSYQVNPDTMEVDNSIDIDPGSGGTMPINTGTQMNGQIAFTAPNGNVIGGGMRFGNSGPINVVPVAGAQGQTSGILNLPFGVSSSTCNNLSKVCHDIKCYEFAITADGKISRANIRDVALMCGGCGEPSCAPLINPPCPPAANTGSYNFSLSSGSGYAACGPVTGITADNGWVVVASNVGSSGSYNFTSDYYNGGCSSCPALQISDPNSTAYVAISGSGYWSGGAFYFSGTMKRIEDLVGGGGSTYSLTGSVSCN